MCMHLYMPPTPKVITYSWVHSASFRSFGRALGVIWPRSGGYRGHSGSFGRAQGSFGFIRARPVRRRVYSGWLGSSGSALGVVGYIRVSCVH